MITIGVRNVHEALPEGIRMLQQQGIAEQTRNGPVTVAPMPVTTLYTHPRERVLFWPERDANPFFHFYEALWMLGGRNDVRSLTRFVGRMVQFSDDGETFHGAYGHRWRHHFGYDQIKAVVDNLKVNPTCRRQVISIYDARHDLTGQQGMKDIPCNLAVHFMNRGGALDMTVFNRSNDIIWGAYGANAVHFSMLQEFIATAAGLPVGMYWQVSDNFHGYDATLEPLLGLADRARSGYTDGVRTPYEGDVRPFRLMTVGTETWLQDLDMFLDEEGGAIGYRDPFFRHVALPMMSTHIAYKGKHYDMADELATDIKASDWRLAVQQWLDRRRTNRESRKSSD